MTKPVVTLFEQYGAGADYVGPKVAEKLGVEYLGQRWSSEDLEASHALQAAEQEQNWFDRLMIKVGMGAEPQEGTPVHLFQAQDHDAVQENNKLLNSKAANGLVVLGRNATTAIRAPRLNIKLVGNLESRIKHAVAAYRIDEATARRRQNWEDTDRAAIALHYYNWDPRVNEGFDHVIDTSDGNLDAVVDRIVSLAKAKFA